MENKGCMLAEIQGFGRLYDCGNCGNLHLSVGPVSLTLTIDAYMQLVALLNTSAANFEVWLQANRAGAAPIEQEQDSELLDGDI